MEILVTGAFGFLGSIFCNHFSGKGNVIFRLGRLQGDYQFDLASDIPVFDESFDVVVHCAGKAHMVPKSPEDIEAFYNVNLEGTKNLLGSLVNGKPKHFVFISTVAVYGKEVGADISEMHSLNGTTPYADSKIKAEGFVADWGKQNDVPTLILRLPLLVGPNPPGNLGKMIRGISKNRYLSINKGKARRSMVMAEDVAKFISDNFERSGTYNLTDGHHPSFHDLELVICNQLNKRVLINLPGWMATLLGKIGDLIPKSPVNSNAVLKMMSDLTFDDTLARTECDWNPNSVVDNFKIK